MLEKNRAYQMHPDTAAVFAGRCNDFDWFLLYEGNINGYGRLTRLVDGEIVH